HLHDDRLGDRDGAGGFDQLREALVDRALGGSVVLDPRRGVGQDHAAARGGASAGASEMARAPRIASASSRVMGWPASWRRASSTAAVLVRTPKRSMTARTNASSS